jgi:hypothetical protein
MSMFLLFILGVILGLAVSPGWFWVAGIALFIILVAELSA